MEYPAISTTVAEIFSGLCSRLPYSRTRQRTLTGCRNMCCPSSAKDKSSINKPGQPSAWLSQLSPPFPLAAGKLGAKPQDLAKIPLHPLQIPETEAWSLPQGLTLVEVVTGRAAQLCEAWLSDGLLLAQLGTDGPLSKTVISY